MLLTTSKRLSLAVSKGHDANETLDSQVETSQYTPKIMYAASLEVSQAVAVVR